MRVILDLSALHGERFDALLASPLRDLCQRKRTVVFHTQVFLEELLRGYGSSRENRWQEKLRFVIGMANSRFFLESREIWRNELVRGQCGAARVFYPAKASRDSMSEPAFRHGLESAAETGDLADVWYESRQAREESDRKRENARRLAGEVRRDVMARLRGAGGVGSRGPPPFSGFREAHLARTGRQLMDLVDMQRAGALADVWQRAPDAYPFYTAFVEGFLFAGLYAAIRHNEPIDRNAQAEYEQLCHMVHADLVVSDDDRFLRSAFEELWAPRGKRLMSTESFVALTTALV